MLLVGGGRAQLFVGSGRGRAQLLGNKLPATGLGYGCRVDGRTTVFDAERGSWGRKARTDEDTAAEMRGEFPRDTAADGRLNSRGSPRAVEVRKTPPVYPQP